MAEQDFLDLARVDVEASADDELLGPAEDPQVPVVILRADKACKYGDVWKVLDSCQRAGFKYWQLRAMTQSAELRVPDQPWLAADWRPAVRMEWQPLGG